MTPNEVPPCPCARPPPLVPVLRDENDLEEWEDLLIKCLRVMKLEHILEAPREEPASARHAQARLVTDTKLRDITTANKPNESRPGRNGPRVESDDALEKARQIPLISLGFLDEILGETSGDNTGPSPTPSTKHMGKKTEDEAPKAPDEDTDVCTSRVIQHERDQVLALLASSISPIRNWLLNQGWDADERDPAKYFASIKECFSRNALVNSDLEINELRFINSKDFDTIRSYQERLLYLRRRMFMIGHLSGHEGETKMLWYAIDGLKKSYPEIHARLVKDLLAKDGSSRKLTWSRLMMQLAHMHERKEQKREPYYALVRSSG